jgi:hypothetical protein
VPPKCENNIILVPPGKVLRRRQDASSLGCTAAEGVDAVHLDDEKRNYHARETLRHVVTGGNTKVKRY